MPGKKCPRKLLTSASELKTDGYIWGGYHRLRTALKLLGRHDCMGTSCDKRTGKKSHGPMTAEVV